MSNNYTRDLVYFSESVHDGTATGSSYLTTVRPSENPVLTYPLVVGVCVTSEENVLTPAVISVGTNSPNYNNIVSSQSVGGSIGILILPLINLATSIEPETDIYVKVNTACIPELFQTPTLEFKVGVVTVEI